MSDRSRCTQPGGPSSFLVHVSIAFPGLGVGEAASRGRDRGVRDKVRRFPDTRPHVPRHLPALPPPSSDHPPTTLHVTILHHPQSHTTVLHSCNHHVSTLQVRLPYCTPTSTLYVRTLQARLCSHHPQRQTPVLVLYTPTTLHVEALPLPSTSHGRTALPPPSRQNPSRQTTVLVLCTPTTLHVKTPHAKTVHAHYPARQTTVLHSRLPHVRTPHVRPPYTSHHRTGVPSEYETAPP